MANSDKDILITPSTGSSTASPKIEFVGANSVGSDTITMQTLYDGTKTTLSFEGSAGDLFSIVNDLTTNPIFSVNNASGVSCIEVDNNGGTRLAEFSGNVGIGNSSPTQKLDVTGNILASGTLTASGGNSGNWNTAYGWGNHASAGYLTFVPTPVNGSWWNSGFVSVGADGVMEVGKYLDFHTSNTGGNVDYDLRVTASPGALSVGGTISATGGNSTNWNTAYGWGNHASQSYATQSYVGTQISNLVAAAPATLDTLNELAAALGDDPNFATTVTNSIGTKWTQDNTKISQWNTAYGWGNHASAGYTTYTANQAVNTNSIVTFNQVYTTNNGAGTNYKIGDDVWIGDINIANTFRVQGSQNAAAGYITFGNASNAQLGRTGTGSLTWDSQTVWHQGNDGSGSGLDADLLDGQHGSYYYSSANPPPTYTETDTLATVTGRGASTSTDITISAAGRTLYNSNSHAYIQVGPSGGGAAGTFGAHRLTTSGALDYTTYIGYDTFYSDTTQKWHALRSNLGRKWKVNFGGYHQNKFTIGTYDGGGTSGSSIAAGWLEADWTERFTVDASGANGVKVLGNTVWHAGNDGSGSGLDADLLDGQHGSYYYSAGNPPPAQGDITGVTAGTGLTGGGTSGTVTLNVIGGSGITANADNITVDSTVFRNNSAQYLQFNTTTGEALTFKNSTSGGLVQIGLQQNDTDGMHHRAYLKAWKGSATASGNVDLIVRGSGGSLTSDVLSFRSGNASPTWRGQTIWNAGNDGSGSGLDADLLDGQHGSYYAPASHVHSYLPLSGGTLTGTLIARDIRIASGYNLQRSNHHTGHLEGSYNNVASNGPKSNPIYTIGSSYNPSDAAFGNMYGIGFCSTAHTGISFTGMSNWGMYVAADGDARVWLDGSAGVVTSTGQHYVGSNVVWNAGNDGSGSGLDADLLDGVHGSSFLRSDANDTASGQYLFSKVNDHAIQIGTIRGLAVGSQGGQFIQLYERVNIGGPSGWGEASTTAAPSNGLSTYGGASLATHTGSVTISGSTAWHAGNDGSGSGLDADLLDGYQLSTTRNAANTVPVRDANGYANFGWINTTSGSTTGTARIYASNDGYIRYVTPTTFRNNLGLWWTGNDGSGSGLDADLLDGQHGSYYAPASHNHSGVYLPVSGKAVDSELLDGIDSSRFIYGSGNVGKSTSSSSFQAQPSGFFFYSAATGAPTTEWYNWITARGDSWGNGGEYSFQLANSFWNKKLYFQHVQTGGYQGWDEIWTSATDGAGSGLDADLLDGQHGSYYAPASHVHSYLPINNPIATGILVAPDIRARKSQTQGNYTTAALWTESHSSTNTGIAFHISGNVGKMLDMRTDGHLYWENGRVWSATSDGSGSGLDADLLDGQHGSYYYPASNPNGYTSNVGDITGVTAGNGLTGGGSSGTPTLHVGSGSGISVAADTVGVDSSVIRTTGAQSMSGVKTHTSRLALSAGQMLSLGDTNHHLVQVATGYSGVAIDGPRLQGHQGGELATNIGSNQYALRWDNGGNTHSRVSSRAPIFYDTNNTNYYVDPAGTGTSLRIKGDILCDDNYGKGFVGKYSASRLQHVFSMGAAYRLAADGTTSGNLYGMAWSHPNAGSIGGANNLSDHGLLIINNGVFKAAISSRAVFSQDVRGTRFYDYNSTGYYVDPAATSVLNIVQSNEIVHYNSTSSNVENYLSGTGNSGTKLYWRTDSAVELMNVDMSGNFTAKGNVIAYSASDRQLKENIKPIKNALEKVLTIGGYEFDWNSKQTAWSEGTHDIGVIAQEIELVAPEATRKRADGYLGVDYEKLIPLLIESIKELNSKVETLELQLAQKEQ